jgi:hypothetical protein
VAATALQQISELPSLTHDALRVRPDRSEHPNAAARSIL